MSIVVFGSINMDLVVRTPRFPAPGETLTGRTFFTASGGKGANQAVAAARLGATTRMVGRVGDDMLGTALLENLRTAGVDASGVQTDAGVPTGTALIVVDDAAENQIIIVPGANGEVGGAELARLEQVLEGAKLLLLQLEVPLEAVLAAAAAARARGVTVMLDPAPARALPAVLYQTVDILTPNESEAALLLGAPVRTQEEALQAARALQARGTPRVIVKLGARGLCWRAGEDEGFLPAFPVRAVDTVAAGDAFNGGLAAALSEGRPFAEALRWGAAAGALSTTKEGAQPSMPDRQAVLALLGG